MTLIHPLENVGTAFDRDKMLEVRTLVRQAVDDIAANVRPGMVEEEAVAMARTLLAERGMVRNWHDVYVRFGTNTTKTFGAPSDAGVVLGETDVFFVDIGPVWKKWEGDAGDTFVVGDDPDMRRGAEDARTIFHLTRQEWLRRPASGRELYEFAARQAAERGWKLNLDLSGHRLADFPHAAIHDGPLAEVDFHPSSLLWVLEIHLLHPQRPFGTFFEDMLLEDSFF